MKILEITFIPPSLSSGGGLGTYQSIKSLAGNGDVDYIGPEFEDGLFSGTLYKVKKLSILEPKQTGILRQLYRVLFKGISTSFYDSWKEASISIDWSKYDFIYIELSRYDFLINKAHEFKKKCMVRVQDIESDYGEKIYKRSKKLADYFRYKSYAINERQVFNKADCLICITNHDIERGMNLYNTQKRIVLNPICLEKKPIIIRKRNEHLTFLITGTLSYGPNAQGAVWFIENIWDEVLYKFPKAELIVAGACPGDAVKSVCESKKSISLIDTPPEMEVYFRKADIYIATVFDGAGMKVKVAEALSYGLPVIGTPHSFIGYEEIQCGKYISNSKEEFVKNIEIAVQRVSEEEQKQIVEEFNNFLSMDTSINRYKEYIKNLLK